MSEHIKSIFSFKDDIIKSLININSLSEVAAHFSLTGHSMSDHFNFIIFDSNVINSEIRKSIETDLNIFKLFKIRIINLKQPSHFKILYLTFHS
jgi:hypothetical protein